MSEERYELINGRGARTIYENGRPVYSVTVYSCFWSDDDAAWLEVIHDKYGLMSRRLKLQNEFVGSITYSYPDAIEPFRGNPDAVEPFRGNPDCQQDVRDWINANPDAEASDGGRLG